MKKLILRFFILPFIISPLLAVAQKNSDESNLAPKTNFKEKIYYGGGFGIGFGSTVANGVNAATFSISFSPLVGYRITEDFSAGVGLVYQYSSIKSAKESYTMTSVGGRIFGRYNIFESLYAYTEYEVLNVPDIFSRDEKARVNVLSWYVGAGYRQNLGGRMYLNLLVLWNVIPTEYFYAYNSSPFQGGNPIIRGGVTIGI